MMHPSTFRPLISLGALFGLGVLYLPTSALAQARSHEDGPRTEVVSYADLDVGKAAGRAVLTGRIHAAATRVCGPAPDRASLNQSVDYWSCMSKAQRDAVQTVAADNRLDDGSKFAQLAPAR